MLVVGVERDREQAASFPLKAKLAALVVPDRGGAVAGDDIDHLLIHLALRSQFAARRDLAYVGVIDAAVAIKIDESAAAATPGPLAELNGLDVLHAEAGDDGNALAPLVGLVGIDLLDIW